MTSPPSPPVPLVRLVSIQKTYLLGDDLTVHALRDVSLSLFRGEMVAIMGASGSGKSTTLNVIGTLDRPTSGEYIFDGAPIQDLDDDELSELRNRKIGFVFQSFHLLPRLTAVANVELPLVYAGRTSSRKERRERARAALARVGLSDREDHLPNQLSGGQQQRVAIARSIVNEPLLLLADEPTGALDSATTHQVMDLFLSLHDESGITVVLVTHDPKIAHYAARTITFADGALITDDEAEKAA